MTARHGPERQRRLSPLLRALTGAPSGTENLSMQHSFGGHPGAPGIREDTPLVNVTEYYQRYYAAGSGHTARAKRLDLAKYLQFLQLSTGRTVNNLTVADWSHSTVQRFVDDALGRESPATVARRLATLKHMGRALSERIPGFVNPARDVRTPRLQLGRPKSLTAVELQNVRKRAHDRAAPGGSFIRARNAFLLDFLLDTGLRLDEVRLLRISQLDERLEWLRNVRTKGKRYRNVYITSAIRESLKHYLKLRADALARRFTVIPARVNRKLPIFISLYRSDAANPDSFLMGSKTLWRAINELSVRLKLHPHLLRHTYATELLDETKDIRLVAQALGHSDVRTTMRYTERSAAEVASALERTRRSRK